MVELLNLKIWFDITTDATIVRNEHNLKSEVKLIYSISNDNLFHNWYNNGNGW